MNTHFRPIALAVALAAASAAHAQQPEGAQVIFSSANLTVIDAKGVERAVKQGDFVQPGERLVAPPGVMGQLRLPDGTLVGARPGTDLKLDMLVKALGKNIVTLNEGSVRVVNVEPPKGPKPMPVEIVTPVSKLQLTGGDGESIHMKAGNKRGVEAGTYNRLQSGVATMQNAGGELPLQPLQNGFVPKPETLPIPIASLPLTLLRLEPITLLSTTLTPIKTTSTTLLSPTIGTLTNTTLSGPLLTTTTSGTLSKTTLTTTSTFTGTTLATAGSTTGTTGTTGTTSTILQPAPILSTTPVKLLPPPPPPPPKILCKTCVLR